MYRIVKHEIHNHTYYTVQYRFLYMWFTTRDGRYGYKETFNSKAKAEEKVSELKFENSSKVIQTV